MEFRTKYWNNLLIILTDFQKWIEEESVRFKMSEEEIQSLIKEVLINK